jgi:hypothetical protein
MGLGYPVDPVAPADPADLLDLPPIHTVSAFTGDDLPELRVEIRGFNTDWYIYPRHPTLSVVGDCIKSCV